MKQHEFTLQRLRDAFKRLKAGSPERTAADGKISIARINAEAGLTKGAIYYYKEFITEIKGEIAVLEGDRKNRASIDDLEMNQSGWARLRRERGKEKKLKEKYRSQVNDFKDLSDDILKKQVSIMFRCKELEKENALLAGKYERKVIPIKES